MRAGHKLGGEEPQVNTRTGYTAQARLMESQIRLLPACSVALWGECSEMAQWSLLPLLSEKELSPSSCTDVRHFCSTLYATCASQAATQVMMELRGNVRV